MSVSDILTLPAHGLHDTGREGLRLGVIVATVTWLWVAAIDVIAGQPFHTFAALGGIVGFTIGHYLLNIAYGLVLLSAVHGAERAPSLIYALVFGVLTLEGGIAMMTNLLAQAAVGPLAWIGLFGGSLVGIALTLTLLRQSHPLVEHLHRAEDEM